MQNIKRIKDQKKYIDFEKEILVAYQNEDHISVCVLTKEAYKKSMYHREQINDETLDLEDLADSELDENGEPNYMNDFLKRSIQKSIPYIELGFRSAPRGPFGLYKCIACPEVFDFLHSYVDNHPLSAFSTEVRLQYCDECLSKPENQLKILTDQINKLEVGEVEGIKKAKEQLNKISETLTKKQ